MPPYSDWPTSADVAVRNSNGQPQFAARTGHQKSVFFVGLTIDEFGHLRTSYPALVTASLALVKKYRVFPLQINLFLFCHAWVDRGWTFDKLEYHCSIGKRHGRLRRFAVLIGPFAIELLWKRHKFRIDALLGAGCGIDHP